MRPWIVALVSLALAALSHRVAADEVVLRDGTVLSGEVVGAGPDVVVHGRFGALRVPAADIREVRPGPGQGGAPGTLVVTFEPPPAPERAARRTPAAEARAAVAASAAAPSSESEEAAAELARLRAEVAALRRELDATRKALAAVEKRRAAREAQVAAGPAEDRPVVWPVATARPRPQPPARVPSCRRPALGLPGPRLSAPRGPFSRSVGLSRSYGRRP